MKNPSLYIEKADRLGFATTALSDLEQVSCKL